MVESYLCSEDVVYRFKETFSEALLNHNIEASRKRTLAQGKVTGNILSQLGAHQLAVEANNTIVNQNGDTNVLEAEQNDDLSTELGD